MNITDLPKMIRNRLNRDSLYNTAKYWDSQITANTGYAMTMWNNNNLNAHYHTEQLQFLGRVLGSVQGLSVMDVGCGTGRISRYLAERGANVTGVDFSANAIDVARKFDLSTQNPAYRVQSVFAIDDVQAFDLVVSWGSITVACRTQMELLDCMKRLRASLKPKGRALFLEPVHKGFLHRVLNMDQHTFLSVMADAGFFVRHVEHMNFWPARLALAFFPLPEIITAPVYHSGRLAMELFGRQRFGDYLAIDADAR
jgi:2-polyprenyl-3-methyl-5-hydroxy-6-metoxy-1,4-benzoquinol methylase